MRQQQLRVTQLQAQVAAEVQNAVTALHAAKSAADAARNARELQAKLLAAAQESFQAGYSTNLAVIEQQTYLAQAETTEIMAKAAWPLVRSAGRILLEGTPEAYASYVADYFECDVDVEAVAAVLAGTPLSEELVRVINPDASFAVVAKTASDAGFRVAQ